jgi:hypothetical protein
MFSYLSPEQRVPEDHPLRAIRRMTGLNLSSLFTKMYADFWPSIPPGAAAAGAAAAVALHSAERAAAGGRDRLQHPVWLFCRPDRRGDRRCRQRHRRPQLHRGVRAETRHSGDPVATIEERTWT